MNVLCVLQHVEAEYLGLMEDHFEGRNIRFHYLRPFTPGAIMPPSAKGFAGLVILGAGPKGVVSGDLIPSLAPELRLTRDFLERGLPVIGIGAGACILTSAAGGGADDAPLRFTVTQAQRVVPGALGGHLPERFPTAIYMRDRPVLPADAEILAISASGEPVLFQLHGNCLGFLGHPGIKSGMIEDLIMEFEDVPEHTGETLADLRAVQGKIAGVLGDVMVGVIEMTRLMEPPPQSVPP
jgi:GMP synthase-like glutamine amidotransferase